ncbi:MAG: hypothetical protein AAB595_02960 [Patescibacteria group bacterium]
MNEFEVTKEALVKKGIDILNYVENYKTHPYFVKENEYMNWNDSVIGFLIKHNVKNYESDFSKHDIFPKTDREARKYFLENVNWLMGRTKSIPEVEEFIKLLKGKIKYLKSLDSGRTTIYVDIQKTTFFIKGTNLKYKVRKSGKITPKRFDIIMRVIKSNTPIPAKKLGEKGKELSIISKEIGKINKIFIGKLECSEFILGKGGGYRLNSEKFIIKIQNI